MYNVVADKIKEVVDRIKELERMAYYDTLTGAFNRNALESVKKNYDEVGVYVTYVDVNGLKVVNDKLGHEHGDQLLHYVVYMLRELSKKNIIFRIGGDEFLVIGKQHVILNIPEVSYGTVYKHEGCELDFAISQAEVLMKIYKKENFFQRREF